MTSTDRFPVVPSADVSKCPYPAYWKLREEAPVHNVPGTNDYVISRYEDVMFVLRHPESFSSVTYVLENGARRQSTVADLEGRETDQIVATFQGSDAPVHTWKRRFASAHFKPSQVRDYADVIQDVVDALLAEFIHDGEVEFIGQFAQPLGTQVSFMIVGLPLEDAELARKWTRYDGQASPYHSAERQAEIALAVREMNECIDDVVRSRHDNPVEDMVSSFVADHVERNGPELGLQHAAMDLFSVLLGGVGTSSHMLGNIMLQLIRNPEWIDKARGDIRVLTHIVEESLRVESPVQWTPRMATRDVELGGVTIPAGAQILLLWGSANRDGAKFDGPSEFNPDRGDSQQHLAFGHGIHFCLGAPLARLEAQIAFATLLDAMDDIRLTDESVASVDSWVFRGYQRLNCSFKRR